MDGEIYRHDVVRPVAPGGDKMHHTATVLQVIAHMCNRFLHLLAVKHTLYLQGRRNILQNICDASIIFCRTVHLEQEVFTYEYCIW